MIPGEKIPIDGKTCEIVSLIAKGKGGYCYLATLDGEPVVLKQIHYEPCDYFTFEDDKLVRELRDYETLREIGIPMPKLLCFDLERQFLIKQYLPGKTLAEIVAGGGMKPEYTEQIAAMCRLLYPAGLNIDYYPTNFIEQDGQLLYVDYECSPYSDEWSFENWGIGFLAATK